ncbi:TetR/AcrR family transcriptional regulator [Burkholderia plantarii]|uniref:TetR/AcrR family transcriptional regulator n=1 Tax=Burkholderia plantarii TaxID=41899 RepID=UPI0008707972|nr:TetR/AcrR family transcriptional regulator [Burkholderia plantarii]
MRNKSQDVLETALRLFEQEGFQAVGIDRIIAESGVAKMTMYKYFESKDELIAEALREHDRRVMRSLVAFVERRRTFRSRIKAVFQWHDDWFRSQDFSGSLFLNAASEFHNRDTQVRRIVRDHLRATESYVESLFADPDLGREMAPQLMLLLLGATSSAYAGDRKDASNAAWKIADAMLAGQAAQAEQEDA